MRLLAIFKKTTTESGEANAQRFIATVAKLAQDERMVELLPHNGWRGSKGERYGWGWMSNPKWRKRVMQLLFEMKVSVKDARFHAPDSLDGWTFTAISTTPLPRVATLNLDESL